MTTTIEKTVQEYKQELWEALRGCHSPIAALSELKRISTRNGVYRKEGNHNAEVAHNAARQWIDDNWPL